MNINNCNHTDTEKHQEEAIRICLGENVTVMWFLPDFVVIHQCLSKA